MVPATVGALQGNLNKTQAKEVMKNPTDYLEKSKTAKARQTRERDARFQLEPWKSSKALWAFVRDGNRKRAVVTFFTSKVVCVEGEKIDITVNRLNCLSEIDEPSVEKLLNALFATGKDKPRGKGRIIRAIAPRCAQFPLN